MKKFTNQYVAMLFAAATVFSVGCDDNDEIAVDPAKDYDVTLKVAEGQTGVNADYAVDANTQATISAKVTFTSTNASMKRLYITENVQGQGEAIYVPTEKIDLKGDGAVDLEKGDGKTFEYAFNLPVKSGQKTGTVVYKFWATTGNGDFRDQTQRLAVGPGTITVKYGTGANPEAKVKSFTAKMLAAPLKDGSSATFLSLVNGTVYKIKDEAEFAAYWDFGYYNTTGEGAALASTGYYETAFNFVPVTSITAIAAADLNKAYFTISTKTSANFDAVAVSGDLSTIAVTKTDANQKIVNLKSGDIIEFIDNYGKKGLIRVTEIKGTFNSGDYIKLDIKVQA